MNDHAETLGEAAWELLRRIVRERLSRRPGGHLVEAGLERLELQLTLELAESDANRLDFSRRLLQSIDRTLDDAVQHAAAFRPGHAWCHRCERADCEHSAPPGCRHVFGGYAPTGVPQWEDFAQLMLMRKHPDVDRLYEHPPVFLTLVQDKDELHGGMLDAFRNDAYELMGQVVAGYYSVPVRAEEGRGVLALTVQAAASRTRGGRPRVGLNLLGRTPAGEGLDMLWERQGELPWRRAVRWAQSALQTLERSRHGGRERGRRGRNDPVQLEQRVSGILRGLARRLERDQRSRSRRTRHAERRHVSGERPTRKAVDDARTAGSESVMVDERSGTLVVLGDRGRTHFFTPAGLLVSSVRYSREAIARKLERERWRPATAEELETLRSLASAGSAELNRRQA